MSERDANAITVTGPVSGRDLGFCQCHEHIYIKKGYLYSLNPALCIDDFDLSMQELILYRNAGGGTIVDAQPLGCGRDAATLKRLSAETKVNIIASTGFHKLPFYSPEHWLREKSDDEMYRIFLHEINEGMYVNCNDRFSGESIQAKCGVIKAALETENLSDQYRALFHAAAAACKECGTPIMIHTEKNSDPLAVLSYLVKLGVQPHKLCFCHLDRTCRDMGIHKEIAGSGAFLDYDTIGRARYHDDDKELEIISAMLESGFEGQLLLSLDTTRERLQSYGGHISLTYLLLNFIPQMLGYGINNTEINKMTNQNAAKYLAFI